MSELPWLIQRYDKRKGSIWTYLLGRKGRIGRVRWLVKDFIRINLQAEMGLKRREVDLLLRIIREKNAPGRKTHAQIARKLKCSKQDVDELWRAYRDYLRIKSRSGQAKED